MTGSCDGQHVDLAPFPQILLGILFVAGNRWILPIWTKTPHQQPPLDYTELEKCPLPPQQVFDTAEVPVEYIELKHKKESDL